MIKHIWSAVKEHLLRLWPLYILFSAAFLAGLIFGYLTPSAMESNEYVSLSEYYNELLNDLPQIKFSIWEETISAFNTNGLLLLAIFIGGLSVLSFLISPLVLFYKGFGLGFCISFLLANRAFEGIILIILTVLPQALLLIPLLLLASALSVDFSLSLLRKNINERSFFNRFGIYFYRFIWLAAGVMLCAFIQGGAAPFILHLLFSVV